MQLFSVIFLISFISALKADIESEVHSFLASRTTIQTDHRVAYNYGKSLYRKLNDEARFQWSHDLKASVAQSLYMLSEKMGNFNSAFFWIEKYINLTNISLTAEFSDLRIYYRVQALLAKFEGASNIPENVMQEIGQWQQNISHFKYCHEGDCTGSTKVNTHGHCRLTTRGSPFFILSPLKEEVLSLYPVVILFHDILHRSEVEKLKIAARKTFTEAQVISDRRSGSPNAIFYSRRTKVAWISNNVMAELNSRLGAATNMNLEGSGSENFQVAHYQVGGIYVPHYDFIENGAKVRGKVGQRIATMLLYLNDVEEGGATVFPRLGIRVKPKANTALFWYNSFKSTESGNELSLHGACPVLRGEKWAVNKWILSRGQEFTRPCGKTKDCDFKLDDFE